MKTNAKAISAVLLVLLAAFFQAGKAYDDYYDDYGGGAKAPKKIAGVVDLDEITFDKIVDGSHNVFVSFVDGDSTAADDEDDEGDDEDSTDSDDDSSSDFSTELETLAEKFGKHNDVILARVDASDAFDITEKFDVNSYPTLMLFQKGEKTPERYEGVLNADKIEAFLGSKVGFPAVVEELEGIVKKFKSDESSRDKTLKEAREVVEGLDEEKKKLGEYYLKVMEKVMKKGNDHMRGLVQSAAPPPVHRQNVSRRRRIAKAASNAMGETKMDKIEPPENEPGDLVLVLDFGSQYTQLICRRVREVGFYSQLLPSDVSMERIKEIGPKVIVLSGGPNSVHMNGSPTVSDEFFTYCEEKDNALETLRLVDEVFINSIREAGLYDTIWQAFAVFLPIKSSTAGVVERFGKFSRVIYPGLNFLACCIGECVSGAVSLRVRQLDVTIETKTKDNVFVVVVVSVQYEVENDQVYDAFYRLTNPLEQIRAYVFDVVRSTVPKINLDDVFDQKDEIAKAVKSDLAQTMPSYGYHILQTLVTDIEPDSRVKSAMNEINAAQRQRVAAADKAEAEKILVVKAAEADAESKYLAGIRNAFLQAGAGMPAEQQKMRR
eukprot:jgi/Pico_ML_1/54477/g4817.t1